MKKSPVLIILVVVTVVIMFISLLTWAITEDNKERAVRRYQMPNGVLCKSWISNFGKMKFNGCSDGNIYLNPETYKEVRLK